MELVREIEVQMELGECPLWDHRRECLYWVDIIKCTLYRLDWTSGRVATWPLPGLGGGLGLLGDSDLIVAVQTGLFELDLAGGNYAFLLHPSPKSPTQRLNEGKTDGRGNFWIGSMSTLGRIPEGGLFRITPDGEVTKTIDGISVPNALVFFDYDEALFTDSAQRLIWKFDVGPDGRLTNRRVFADDTPFDFIPDGAVSDSEGRVWNAKFGGGRVVVYEADGRTIDSIELPMTQITSCAFCGPNLDHLAITTAKRLLNDRQRVEQARAGNLLIFKTPVVGKKEPVCPRLSTQKYQR